jgi:putative hemolysin
MFPAGEARYKDGNTWLTKPWEEGAIKVIRKAQVPCLHLFSCKTVVCFILFLKISALLNRVKLPSEVLVKTA